ncbi:hypothetical protein CAUPRSCDRAFT_12978 [Caulochytrium protostelioides]|uniref:Clp1 N-terminal domain-containing protein n=1 Tax=Caulochytrium protostelioides TaxID=1555241 RepID=A0A4P9WSG0_9FUNG|nr:hypothetical protein CAUPRSCDRAFT_12978 [Caulochytrium protostelioides]
MQPEGGPAGGAAERPTSQTVLEAGSEYRFEVDWESPVTIQLLRGRAEIAGQELIVGKPYVFEGVNAAIFTWHGCTLEVKAARTRRAEYGAAAPDHDHRAQRRRQDHAVPHPAELCHQAEPVPDLRQPRPLATLD